jgi:hypothetical protein
VAIRSGNDHPRLRDFSFGNDLMKNALASVVQPDILPFSKILQPSMQGSGCRGRGWQLVIQGDYDLLAVKYFFKTGFLPGLQQLPGSAIVTEEQGELNFYLLPGGYFGYARSFR